MVERSLFSAVVFQGYLFDNATLASNLSRIFPPVIGSITEARGGSVCLNIHPTLIATRLSVYLLPALSKLLIRVFLEFSVAD